MCKGIAVLREQLDELLGPSTGLDTKLSGAL